jgi:rusticyanin
VTLLIVAMGNDMARELTGNSPPQWAESSDVYVTYGGLIDPTIVVPAGADIKVIYFNLDTDMPHSLVITSVAPPYPPMMSLDKEPPAFPGAYTPNPTEELPPTGEEWAMAHGYAFEFKTTTAGNYWYVCYIPSHAYEGMYGPLIVR